MNIFDLNQQKRLWDAESKASAAGRDASQANERVDIEVQRLEAKIDGLALISGALSDLLRERTHLTDADIRKKGRNRFARWRG
jgi:outer membrane murein-binding lipoprotein Lpp